MELKDLLQAGLKMATGGGAAQPAGTTPPDSPLGGIAAALAGAMRAPDTPPFGDYVGKLFGQSTPGQQAGLLNQILAMVGPTALAGVSGGLLGKLLSPGQTQLTPEQAAQVSPQDAAEIATAAQAAQPGIIDQVAQYYAQHSTLINTLGAAAFTAAVAHFQSKDKDKAQG